MSLDNIEGLEDIFKSIDKLQDTSTIEAALSKSCALVEAAAKKNAPKGDGTLARSIESKIENLKGIVFTTLEYAPYVEYGTGLFAEGTGRSNVPWKYRDDEGNWHMTKGQKPQPFMRPALNDNRNKILKIFKEGKKND